MIVVVALLVVLAVAGAIGQRRRLRANELQFKARLEQANRDLAAAHAEDRGWAEERLERAAREAFALQHPGVEAERLFLVQVIDRPGTDDDRAIFHVDAGGAEHEVELARRGDDWLAAEG